MDNEKAEKEKAKSAGLTKRDSRDKGHASDWKRKIEIPALRDGDY